MNKGADTAAEVMIIIPHIRTLHKGTPMPEVLVVPDHPIGQWAGRISSISAVERGVSLSGRLAVAVEVETH